jgi:TolB-like protein
MKKIIYASVLALTVSAAHAAIQEVAAEATGSGPTQQQAIAEALLTAAQSVNGTRVSSRVDMASEVAVAVSDKGWSYQGKSSPVFSVNTETSGSVSRFQVLSVSGSGKNYKAKVRAYISKFKSGIADHHQQRMAVLPFQVVPSGFNLPNSGSPREFATEVADQIGTQLVNSHQLSLLSRDFIGEMAAENAFLNWDGAPSEMARIGQKVGADYILVGRVSEAKTVEGRSLYGMTSAERESIRLSWRVIEVNTGKIAAAGSVNQLQRQNMGSLVSESVPASVADLLANQVSHDVLVGLSLQAKGSVSGAQTPELPPLSDAELTPGSSEKPVKW